MEHPAGSINAEPISPRASSGCFGSLVSYFKCDRRDPRREDGGYVEFGEFHYDNYEESQKVGTFNGVFCPVVLSMFSALVFIRMGFIIGNAGLLMTLLQFGISYLILIFTVCSVCAISTNGAIQGGGVYFMISRSLGPEFGGAIGTLFFFANVVSSALCFSACTEGLIENFGPSGYLVSGLPGGHWWQTLYASSLALLALLVNLAGARYFARTSLAIWTATTVCLLSVMLSFFVVGSKEVPIPESNTLTNLTLTNYTGLSSSTLWQNLWPQYSRDYSDPQAPEVSFAVVFGVLFSGVTGVMAGANMSGELKDPSHSIPRGTLWAIVFTGVTYLALALLTAASCPPFLLQNNYLYMLPINLWPPFVTTGVLTATFSAGLSNMIGASRVLEALVKDNIFGMLLSWSSRPWVCVVVSWVGAQLALLGGSLTAIARANCALFLLSYLAVNLACLALELAGAPNFRPTFRWFSWHSCLCGLIGALAMMFLSASLLAALALTLCLGLVISLHLASPAAQAAPWGSISQALIFHQVRKYLLLLDARKEHVKYWRPQVLLLVGGARSVAPLARFSNQLKKGGLLVLGHVVVGGEGREEDVRQLPSVTPWLQLVDHLKIKAFVEQCSAGSVREGARHLVHLSGLGAMKPNTVMLGFHDDEPQVDFFSSVDSPWYSVELQSVLPSRASRPPLPPQDYVALLSDVLTMDKGLCVCRHFQCPPSGPLETRQGVRYIDVWLTDFLYPKGEDPFTVAGQFILQMACILNTQTSWKRFKLRVMLTDSAYQGGVSSSESSPMVESVGRTPARHRLRELLTSLRIQATLHQVEVWGERISSLREWRGGHNPTSRYQLPPDYVQGVNHMLRSNSSHETAVVFLYLPAPPDCQSEGDLPLEDTTAYLSLLRSLTDGLPPTVMVHGQKTVTSTQL